METPYEIWLQLAQWFLWRRGLKSVDDGRTDTLTTEAYKLTYLGTGELKKKEKNTVRNFFLCTVVIFWADQKHTI